MQKLDLIWRDLCIVGRAVWLNLALLLGAALLLTGAGSYLEAIFPGTAGPQFSHDPPGIGVCRSGNAGYSLHLRAAVLDHHHFRQRGAAGVRGLDLPAPAGGMGPLGSENFFRTG